MIITLNIHTYKINRFALASFHRYDMPFSFNEIQQVTILLPKSDSPERILARNLQSCEFISLSESYGDFMKDIAQLLHALWLLLWIYKHIKLIEL